MEICKKHISLSREKSVNPIEFLVYSLVEWSVSVFDAAPDGPALLTVTVEDVNEPNPMVEDRLVEDDELLSRICSIFTVCLITDTEAEEYSLNIQDDVCEVMLEDQVTIRYECHHIM